MKRGFTIIELLIVIAIIGVLSTVIVASLNSSRTKGRAATALSQHEQLEKALTLLALEQERNTWWDGAYFGGDMSPQGYISVYQFWSAHGLGPFIAYIPKPVSGVDYYYVNTGTYTCGNGSSWRGVSLLMYGANDPTLFNLLDQQVDGGDGALCGRIRFSNAGPPHGGIYYGLADNTNNF